MGAAFSSLSPSDISVQHLCFQSAFRSIILLGLLSLGDKGRYYYYFSKVIGETEAQRGRGTCLGPHSKEMVETGLESRNPDSKFQAFPILV